MAVCSALLPPEIWQEIVHQVAALRRYGDLGSLRMVNSTFKDFVDHSDFARELVLDLKKHESEHRENFLLRLDALLMVDTYRHFLALPTKLLIVANDRRFRAVFNRNNQWPSRLFDIFTNSYLDRLLAALRGLKKIKLILEWTNAWLNGDEASRFFGLICAAGKERSIELRIHIKQQGEGTIREGTARSLVLEELFGLRKLRVSGESLGEADSISENCIRDLVARSPNLRSLALKQDWGDVDIILLPLDLKDHPLKELSLAGMKPPQNEYNLSKLRSLRTLDITEASDRHWSLKTEWPVFWDSLRNGGIAPPHIRTTSISNNLMSYLASEVWSATGRSLTSLELLLPDQRSFPVHGRLESRVNVEQRFWEDVLPRIIPNLQSLNVCPGCMVREPWYIWRPVWSPKDFYTRVWSLHWAQQYGCLQSSYFPSRLKSLKVLATADLDWDQDIWPEDTLRAIAILTDRCRSLRSIEVFVMHSFGTFDKNKFREDVDLVRDKVLSWEHPGHSQSLPDGVNLALISKAHLVALTSAYDTGINISPQEVFDAKGRFVSRNHHWTRTYQLENAIEDLAGRNWEWTRLPINP